MPKELAPETPPPPPKKRGRLGTILTLVLGIALGAGALFGVSVAKPGLFGGTPAKAAEIPKREAVYYPLAQPFTSNLKDSQSFVQMGLAVSAYDAATIDAVKLHETALRSTVLLAVAEEQAEAMTTLDGKRRLAARLKAEINRTLEDRGAGGQIDQVYFTSFVVQ